MTKPGKNAALAGVVRLITSMDRARGAAANYKAKQCVRGQWPYGVDRKLRWERLVADPDPTPESVAAILGDSGWTDLRCNCCGYVVAEIIEVGDEPDYESKTANVCRECWAEGSALWRVELEKMKT